MAFLQNINFYILLYLGGAAGKGQNDCVFQTLIGFLVGMKFSIDCQMEGLSFSVVHQMSGNCLLSHIINSFTACKLPNINFSIHLGPLHIVMLQSICYSGAPHATIHACCVILPLCTKAAQKNDLQLFF